MRQLSTANTSQTGQPVSVPERRVANPSQALQMPTFYSINSFQERQIYLCHVEATEKKTTSNLHFIKDI